MRKKPRIFTLDWIEEPSSHFFDIQETGSNQEILGNEFLAFDLFTRVVAEKEQAKKENEKKNQTYHEKNMKFLQKNFSESRESPVNDIFFNYAKKIIWSQSNRQKFATISEDEMEKHFLLYSQNKPQTRQSDETEKQSYSEKMKNIKAINSVIEELKAHQEMKPFSEYSEELLDCRYANGEDPYSEDFYSEETYSEETYNELECQYYSYNYLRDLIPSQISQASEDELYNFLVQTIKISLEPERIFRGYVYLNMIRKYKMKIYDLGDEEHVHFFSEIFEAVFRVFGQTDEAAFRLAARVYATLIEHKEQEWTEIHGDDNEEVLHEILDGLFLDIRDSKDSIGQLDFPQIIKRYKFKGKSSEQCLICLQKLTNESNKILVLRFDCNHMFHKDCVLPWFKKNRRCPTCREVILRNQSYSDKGLDF